jgi:hypothetical protein
LGSTLTAAAGRVETSHNMAQKTVRIGPPDGSAFS